MPPQNIGNENSIFIHTKKNGKDFHGSASEQWMNRRLAGLTVHDFCDEPFCICCTSHFEPPPGFEEGWWEEVTESFCNKLPRWNVDKMHAFIVICNPFVPTEVGLLFKFVNAVDELGHDAPPMLWVPHTVSPSSDEYKPFSSKEHTIVRDVQKLGIDGIINGEPQGFDLALAIRSQLKSAEARSKALTDTVNLRRDKEDHLFALKDCIHSMIWEWTRIRLAPSVPPVDWDIPPGEPKEIGDTHTVGKLLGRGAVGSVFKLDPRRGVRDEGLGLVVKLVSKEAVNSLSDLKTMRRTIDVMQLLSSKEHQHPNIVQLHKVYHSVTHVMFVMEDGGPENLYRRLCYRNQGPVHQWRPLSLESVEFLIEQAVTVIQYIHMSVGVCHRDIKPENIIVHKQNVLKLADFDLAIMHQPGVKCRTPCGTVPFSAPEVQLDGEYDGLLCDVWSLGVVILEMLCGCRKVEEVVGLGNKSGQPGDRADKFIARKIRQHFALPDTVNNLIQQHHLAEVGPLCSTMSTVLTGMLHVDCEKRWSSDQVYQVFMASRE